MHAVPASRPLKKISTPHGGKLKKKQPPTRPSRLKSWLTAFPCSKEQREVLLLHFEPRTAQPGERIIRAGEKADAVYFVVDGQVEVAVGDRRIKLGPGDFFGEMALISGLPRAADVTALDYSKLATLSRRDFRQFLTRYPAIRDRIAALASERREMNRHLASENA